MIMLAPRPKSAIPMGKRFEDCRKLAFDLYKKKGENAVQDVCDQIFLDNKRLPMEKRRKLLDLKTDSQQRLFIQFCTKALEK